MVLSFFCGEGGLQQGNQEPQGLAGAPGQPVRDQGWRGERQTEPSGFRDPSVPPPLPSLGTMMGKKGTVHMGSSKAGGRVGQRG